MLRKLALSLAVAGVLGVSNANALGLGEINVRSALNEPLNAEIRLLQVRDLSPLQIQPRMASVDDFSLAGVSRSRFINDVRFQVHVSPDGTGVIRVTSTEPVREPFLNFLVEVNWPSGRMVREYTLLLDPPMFDPVPVARRIEPGTAAVSTPVRSEPVRTALPAASAPTTPARMATGSGQIYVDARTTLWELALKHRPDSSVTPQQMMIALLEKNPASFPTNNINNLRSGTVMDIPSLSEINRLTPQQAAAEVARQAELWRQGRSAATAPARQAAADTASGTESAAAEAAPEAPADAELKIVTLDTPEPEVEVEQAVVGDQPDAAEPTVFPSDLAEGLLQRSEEIDNRLSVTQEVVDKIERENRDLQEQLASIQEQLVLMRRLMEAKDQELATLQAQAAQQRATDSGLMDRLNSLPVIGGLAAALVAALGALLLARRRKKPTEKPAMFTAPDALREESRGGAAAAGVAAGAVAATAASADESNQPSQSVDEAPAPQPEPENAGVDEDDFQDLDLDLDLDMDLDLTDDEESTDVKVIDEEYDLSAEADYDALLDATEPEVEPDAETSTIDESLDDEELDLELPTEEEAEPAKEAEADELSLDDDLLSLDDLQPETTSALETVEPVAEEDLDEGLSLDDLLTAAEEAEGDKDEAVAEVEPDAEAEEDDGLEFTLNQPVADDVSVSEEAAEDEDDLDALLGSLEMEQDEPARVSPQAADASETLSANISHDLEMGLDHELEELLNSTDDEIELEESNAIDEAIDLLESHNLLDGTDENETKLDLARAYLDMDDSEGAREILEEILRDGNAAQKQEAQKLIDSLS